jgi:hypothetical protein
MPDEEARSTRVNEEILVEFSYLASRWTRIVDQEAATSLESRRRRIRAVEREKPEKHFRHVYEDDRHPFAATCVAEALLARDKPGDTFPKQEPAASLRDYHVAERERERERERECCGKRGFSISRIG